MSKRPHQTQATPEGLTEAMALIEEARKDKATSLSLMNLGLIELPESISQLVYLQELNLYGNKLTALPESIGNLNKVRWLNLTENNLTSLPHSIGQMKQLRTLYIAFNRLTVLPDSIGQLHNLQHLALSDNHLKKLPYSIGNLAQLKQLLLSDNRLTSLPESLLNLQSLKALFLHENDALKIPAELLGPTIEEADERRARPAKPIEILKYYFKVHAGARRPLNEAKLILVGRGAVGKTSIVNRLVHRTFKDERKTEGIKITEWPLKVGRKKDSVRLNVWDFGGQEIMHATHQFFLTERSLYLLVLSGREGGEDAEAEYWLKLIQSFGGDSPVIIVLNKVREHPFDVNRSALEQKYSFIREFIKTDCKDGKDGFGIAQLRRVVERETDKLEHLRDAFPASWFSIKDKLAGMRKNYLSFDDYRKECARLGEEDPKAQESLALYLHSLGIALNYKDDQRLKDTHVLNPRWVTNGIYKILNANQLEKQKGEIRLGDLAGILNRRIYPKEMHGFLLNLMKKFELCFSLPGKDSNYLIPELLSKQEPKQARDFDPRECLNFQYHYPVLPEGLLPRFVVRTHVLSDVTPRWRTGVILKLEENLALVKADAQDRRVFINIKGPVEGRRRLLSIIRANFDRMHADIPKLQPSEIVPLPQQPGADIPYKELLAWEDKGKLKFEKIVDSDVVELDVHELLNGVEIEAERERVRDSRRGVESRRAASIFVSYSHKDERQLNELKTHLSPLERQNLIDTWHDRRIVAGEEFGQKINENIESADVILLLVSADFIASKYCYEIEMKRALERHEKKEARVVPVIIDYVNWKAIPELSKLTAVPKDGKPVPKWPKKAAAWLDVSERVQEMLEAMRSTDPPGRRVLRRMR